MDFNAVIPYTGIIQAAVAVIVAITTLTFSFIRAWNTTRIEIVLSSIYQRIVHDFKLTFLITFFMIGAIIALSYQSTHLLSLETYAGILVISFLIFTIFFLILFIHALSLIFRTNHVIRMKLFRFLSVCTYLSILITLYLINVLLFIQEISLGNLIVFYITQLFMLYIVLLGISYYIKQLTNSEYHYEFELIADKEREILLQRMVLLNTIKPDIQILCLSKDNPKKDPNIFPLYIFYITSGVLQKVHQVRRGKQRENLKDVIWSSSISAFTTYIKNEFNLEKNQSPESVESMKISLMNLNLLSLKRALSKGKSMKMVLSPALILGILALFAQISLSYFPLDSEIKITVGIVLGFTILGVMVNTRSEHLIAIHFISLVEECIEEKKRI